MADKPIIQTQVARNAARTRQAARKAGITIPHTDTPTLLKPDEQEEADIM